MGLFSLSLQQKLLFKMIIGAIIINKTHVITNCSTNTTFLILTLHVVTQFNIYRLLKTQQVVVNLGKLGLQK